MTDSQTNAVALRERTTAIFGVDSGVGYNNLGDVIRAGLRALGYDGHLQSRTEQIVSRIAALSAPLPAGGEAELERLEAELIEARTLHKGFYEWLIERDLIARGEEIEWEDIVTALTEHEIELLAAPPSVSGEDQG